MRRVELVLALDVLERDRAFKIVNEVKDYISHIKVNYPIVLSNGLDIIRELSKIKPVIADFKIADVPHVSSLIAKMAFESCADAVIVHGFSGRRTVDAVLKVARSYGGEVYVVTELTSSEDLDFSDEIAKMAVDLGCHGIIAPSTKPKKVARLKEIVGDLKILCPGIGAQGGSLEIVKYATHIIVGRSIYNSENPRDSARKILDNINSL